MILKLERKLGKYAVPNLMRYVVIVYALGFIVYMINPQFYDAYLMLTIPVTPRMHIVSKLICSVVWYLAAQVCKALVTMIMIFADKDDVFGISGLFRVLITGRENGGIDTENIVYILMNFLNSLMLIIFVQLFLYMVFVIASLSNKNRGILTVLIAMGGSVLLSWGYGMVFSLSLKLTRGDFLDYLSSSMRYVPQLAYYAVLSIVFYFVTAFILDKKYNLQ